MCDWAAPPPPPGPTEPRRSLSSCLLSKPRNQPFPGKAMLPWEPMSNYSTLLKIPDQPTWLERVPATEQKRPLRCSPERGGAAAGLRRTQDVTEGSSAQRAFHRLPAGSPPLARWWPSWSPEKGLRVAGREGTGPSAGTTERPLCARLWFWLCEARVRQRCSPRPLCP